MVALALALAAGGLGPSHSWLGTAVRVPDDRFTRSRAALELALANTAPILPISDDGDLIFDGEGGYAACRWLPTLQRVDYQHPASYIVRVLAAPLRAAAWTYGQNFAKSRDVAANPFSGAVEVHTSQDYRGVFAAKDEHDWLDGRTVTGKLGHRPTSFLVVSHLTHTEGPGYPNRAGVAVVPSLQPPLSIAYKPHGATVGVYRVLRLGRREAVLEFGRYRLGTGRLLKEVSPKGWVRLRSDAYALGAGSPDMIGYAPTAVAVDAATGRCAALDRRAVVERAPGRRQAVRRPLPSGWTLVAMTYLRGRLVVTIVNRQPNLAKAVRTVRSYVAAAAGWQLVRPYYLHGASENGRFVLARDVVSGDWLLFDDAKPRSPFEMR